jgi:hypothetical protein
MHASAALAAPLDMPARQQAEILLLTVSELNEIIRHENSVLASGYPAGLAVNAERKTELAWDYAEMWEELGPEGVSILARDPEFGQVLTAAVTALRRSTQENLNRLDAAMTASRRRIESVITALQDTVPRSAGYGANGSVPLELRLPPLGTDFHA